MQQVWARKNVQETKFEAAEMILDPWNQQCKYSRIFRSNLPGRKRAGSRVSGRFVAMIIFT